MLTTGFLLTQACGKKSNEATAETAVAKNEVVLTPAEKKAKMEQQRKARTERWRVEHEKVLKNTPTYTDASGNLIYNKPESEPVFVGGNKAMVSYLEDNVKFPKDALDKQEEGLVFVDFVITKSGTVRDVEVTEQTNEDVDPSFRSEAARVVSSMPKWVPGRQNGKAVDVKFSLPVSFQIL